ncbi:Pyrophosphate-energized vacuolar membrane proton pump [Nymphaea thermarum]|nr:Pyrophosphate-energized vacuolar membrane proton pump [Nymphaea thermarum]
MKYTFAGGNISISGRPYLEIEYSHSSVQTNAVITTNVQTPSKCSVFQPRWFKLTDHARALGSKGFDSHKAPVIGDTIGDPLKDTSGPSLNILIKLVAVELLLIDSH